jgi:plasmid stability protein
MSALTIPNLDSATLELLRDRASIHGHSPEDEAKEILAEALRPSRDDIWSHVNATRERLSATGRSFGDSVDLVREDRSR